jgi:hypothetical protein
MLVVNAWVGGKIGERGMYDIGWFSSQMESLRCSLVIGATFYRIGTTLRLIVAITNIPRSYQNKQQV